jgi:hypothetical protein
MTSPSSTTPQKINANKSMDQEEKNLTEIRPFTWLKSDPLNEGSTHNMRTGRTRAAAEIRRFVLCLRENRSSRTRKPRNLRSGSRELRRIH